MLPKSSPNTNVNLWFNKLSIFKNNLIENILTSELF